MSEPIVAARLRIPEQFIRMLARDDFGDIIDKLK